MLHKLFYKVPFSCQRNCLGPLAPTVEALEAVCLGKLLPAPLPGLPSPKELVKVQLWRAGAILFPWKPLACPSEGAL